MNPKNFYVLAHTLLILGSVVAIYYQAWATLPALFASTGTLILSYHAYLDAKNKLRLELYDKRYEIYSELIKTASHFSIMCKFDEPALQAAHNSFRGLGYHKYRFLFGKDVHDYLDGTINGAFSTLVSHQNIEFKNMSVETMNKYHEAERQIIDIMNIAPTLFAPYLYFGDIRSS